MRRLVVSWVEKELPPPAVYIDRWSKRGCGGGPAAKLAPFSRGIQWASGTAIKRRRGVEWGLLLQGSANGEVSPHRVALFLPSAEDIPEDSRPQEADSVAHHIYASQHTDPSVVCQPTQKPFPCRPAHGSSPNSPAASGNPPVIVGASQSTTNQGI